MKRQLAALGFCLLPLAIAKDFIACNASSQQVAQTVQDGVALASCILQQVLGGVTDPAQLLSCAGATEELIVQVIDDFTTEHAADATSGALAQSLTTAQIGYLNEAKLKAVEAIAGRRGGK